MEEGKNINWEDYLRSHVIMTIEGDGPHELSVQEMIALAAIFETKEN